MDGKKAGEQEEARQEVEVVPRPKRRKFSEEYKADILEKWARSTSEQRAELLRKERLFSSNLSEWRRQAEERAAGGGKPQDPKDLELAQLRRMLEFQTARAERAEAIVEVQKKLSQLLGVTIPKKDGER